jgi:alcohol dehydrogenase class IV
VWDNESQPAVKRSLDEPWGYAERAFVDPALTLSCPAAVTRDSALDALAHALESLWNRQANPLSDRLAVQAARRVIAYLPDLLAQPQDLGLRTQLSLAALEAGMAFSQTRTALAHALSYEMTLTLGTPHGLACALWLPTAWTLALGRSARTDASLAAVFDVPAAEGAARLRDWLQGLGIAATPAAFGITDAEARVQAALHSPRGRNFLGAQ